MSDTLLLLTCCLGLLAVAVPVIHDGFATLRARQMISSMTSTSNETYDPARIEQLTQAQLYNLQLGGEGAACDNLGLGGCNQTSEDILDLTDNAAAISLAPYEDQLCMQDSSAVCWIEIPPIDVAQPTNRGTSDEALATGAGHLEWTSLPVGGASSHCVIAAHSGMRDTRMFDDLDQMRVGDEFYLHTLGDVYAYRVFDIETLLPNEALERCRIVKGMDLCTLVTCTPYGINTHRLLVHGERIPYVPPSSDDAPAMPRLHIGKRTRPLLVVLATLLGTLAIIVPSRLVARHRRPQRNRGLAHG